MSALRQRRRKVTLPPLTDGQQVLFTFDVEFPPDRRRPEAEKLLAARRPTPITVAVPPGMNIYVRDSPAATWGCVTAKALGRPRKTEPSGTWVDSDVLARRVATIVGRRDEREDIGADVLDALSRLARRLLGSRYTTRHRDRLRQLALTQKVKASVITRQLVAWRHGIHKHDVERMMKGLHGKAPRPRVKMYYC